jgi:hypothetical protein
LQPCFVSAGALGEDVEDDLLPVQHGNAAKLFPVALLARCEFVVENDAVQPFGFYPVRNLLRSR